MTSHSRKSLRPAGSGASTVTAHSTASSLPPGGGSRTDPTSVASFVPQLADLFKPHIESFNFMLAGGAGEHETQANKAGTEAIPGLSQSGLDMAVADMKPLLLDERKEQGFPSLRVWIDKVEIGYPTKAGDDSTDSRLMPNECRELGISYCAPLMVTFNRRVGDGPTETLKRRMGVIPIMTKSARCHLQHLSRQQLLEKHEEADEMGGTFIVNGIDRLIRLLIVNRRHYPTAVIRPAFGKRGAEYSNLAVQMRCVKPDQSSKTITLHYLHNGSINCRFSYRKQEYFIPVVLLLKALNEVTDREIYDAIVAGQTSNAFLTDRVELMLRAGHVLNFAAPEKQGGMRSKILEYLGKSFRIVTRPEASTSDLQIGKDLLADNLFVHCNAARDDPSGSEDAANKQKFRIMIHMIQKLYALAQGTIKPDNPDALHCQEILLPGHLFLMILKEKLEECLLGIKQTIVTDMRLHPTKVQLNKELYFRKVLDAQKDVGRALHYFLVTGNLISSSGLDLMQVSGYTIVAERLNYFRYLSHFRSVHRGQFFTTMKTTEVRKLLPESFGFLCPAHTPDGSPCGLLSHLTNIATILTHNNPIPLKSAIACLIDLGLLPVSSYPLGSLPVSHYLPVILDGVFVGSISHIDAQLFCNQIRLLKNQHHAAISRFMEIYAIFDYADGLYPAITLYTTPQRVLRPVRYLVGGSDAEKFNAWAACHPPVGGGGYAGPGYLEWIGSQEQITMEIAIRPEDFRAAETTHMELSPTSMFSVVASMTPFSDFNQSPRNMYQCQMGKQTMGTPFHSFLHRIDNKVFRIQTPQSPLVRNENYIKYNVDNYPLGTNAVVAVISYTGYDMEDAMIINKSAYERGFKHGSVYKYKCWAAGTLLLMYDGTSKAVENIRLHDRLMGPDGQPRVVTTLPGVDASRPTFAGNTAGGTVKDGELLPLKVGHSAFGPRRGVQPDGRYHCKYEGCTATFSSAQLRHPHENDSNLHRASTLTPAMYKIVLTNGGRVPFVVNNNHVLVLKFCQGPSEVSPFHADGRRRYSFQIWQLRHTVTGATRVVRAAMVFDSEEDAQAERDLADAAWQPLTVEMTVDEFLAHSPSVRQHATMFQPSVELTWQPPARPLAARLAAIVGRAVTAAEVADVAWALGMWLSDGRASSSTISQIMSDVNAPAHSHTDVVYKLVSIVQKLGLRDPADSMCSVGISRRTHANEDWQMVKTSIVQAEKVSSAGNMVYTVAMGTRFRRLLQEYNLINNKHVPHDLLRDTVEVRHRLLAGLIDGDGCLNRETLLYHVPAKQRTMIEGIVHLARGLAFTAGKMSPTSSSDEYGEMFDGWSVDIGGGIERVKTVLQHKRAPASHSFRDVHCDGFTLTKVADADYYSFLLDGDGRCLLSDFVVTHNCVDLADKRTRGEPIHHRFGNVATSADLERKAAQRARFQHQHDAVPLQPGQTPAGHKKSKKMELFEKKVDFDGLPRIGQFLQPGDALYTIQDDVRGTTKSELYKEVEPGYVEDVRILGDPSQPELQKAGIKIRINRNPVIGDKFASRAGQKGIMSILYPTENMPFTESGLTPDIIINPHAFPSRMTIGMLIESMAGKSAALNGQFQNSTPFQFSEQNRALDFFGAQLRESGYNYVGTEPMYSGITGEEMRADIFIGCVYYQRLRHMVSDKSQVRATGPVNSLTRQPIKGRKVHGGIRFGEMERDSLLGHGASFLLHDRLMNCSDYHTGFVCTKCGSVLSPTPAPLASGLAGARGGKHTVIVCRNCETSKTVATIALPYVFMYLANELAAMNIKITLATSVGGH